jgi:hypothetical protein
MFTKESFYEVGEYNVDLSTSQDYDLWVRYFLKGKKIRNGHFPVVICSKSTSNLSARVDIIEKQQNNNFIKSKISSDVVIAKKSSKPTVLVVREALRAAKSKQFSTKKYCRIVLHCLTLVKVIFLQFIGFYELRIFRRKNRFELLEIRGKSVKK